MPSWFAVCPEHEGSYPFSKKGLHVNVLVVEDAEELAFLVQLALEGEGWRVDIAGDGATALAMASPDHRVVLVDLGLPDMDGGTLVRTLRSLPGLAELPVIWFTAHGGAVPEGGIGVIPKPFNPADLASQIGALVS